MKLNKKIISYFILMCTANQIKDCINFSDFENPQINSLSEEKNFKQSDTLTQNNIINNFNTQGNDSTPRQIQFNINFYLDKCKPSAFTPLYRHNYNCQHCINNITQKDSKCYIFTMSLEKSGFKFSQKQNNNTVKIEKLNIDNNINNNFPQNEFNNFNCQNFHLNNKFIFNNTNNIVNNFYPNFTKINNVQLYSEADTRENSGIKLNSNEFIEKRFSETNSQEKYENSEKDEDTKINSSLDKKPKIIFECSNTKNNDDDLFNKFLKKKRLRKNNNQIGFLSKFYKENKHWSKKEIKEISERIGLKEKKIYKWLWDQKNKEYKTTKFVINKNDNKEVMI